MSAAKTCRGCPREASVGCADYCPQCFDARDRFIAAALAGSMSAGAFADDEGDETDPLEQHADDAIAAADLIMARRRATLEADTDEAAA